MKGKISGHVSLFGKTRHAQTIKFSNVVHQENGRPKS
jgi:hypothetical protein